MSIGLVLFSITLINGEFGGYPNIFKAFSLNVDFIK
jgi:hypothetical protein